MADKKLLGSIQLMVAAMLWGSTFVAQDIAGNYVGPFTYQATRCVVGSVFLLVLILIIDGYKHLKGSYVKPSKEYNKNLILGGLVCGVVLCLSMNLQQCGIYYGTEPGKAGFITAMYILLVPVYGLFAKKRAGLRIWCCIAVAVVGLFLLCVDLQTIKTSGVLKLSMGDILVILCAFSFALHIVAVDHFVQKIDGVKLSFLQFVVAGSMSFVLMLAFEEPTVSSIVAGAGPILYAGICSSGIAYTLQIIGQKNTPPVIASLVMSLESVFAVITQIIVLQIKPSLQEAIGCVVMFAAIIIAQLPERKRGNKNV